MRFFKYIILALIFLFSFKLYAADYYVRSGGGNYNSAATWSLSSNGPANGSVPSSSDNVYLDAYSGNLTINVSSACRSIDCTGYTGTLTHAAVPLTIGDSAYGANFYALKFDANMTYILSHPNNSAISFVSSATTYSTPHKIDFGGKTTGNVTFDGSMTAWIFVSSHTTGSTAIVRIDHGNVDTNGCTCSWGFIKNDGILKLGSSYIYLTGSSGALLDMYGPLIPGTSTIEISDTSTGAKTIDSGSWGFNNIKFTGDNITITGSNTFSGNFQLNNAGMPNGLKIASGTTQTIVGNFTNDGSVGNLTILRATGVVPAIISKNFGNVFCDYMSIQDITATTDLTYGTTIWFAGSNSTNVSGNTGWVFSPLRFWVGGGSSNNWNAVGPTNWSTASGGSNNASVPANTDNVFLDANSGTGNSVLSADIMIRSLNCSGYRGTLTHNANTKLSIGNGITSGSSLALKLVSTMVYTLGSNTTSSIEFIGTVAPVQSVDFAGQTTGNVTYNGVGGSWKLMGSHITNPLGKVTLTNGTLDTNGYSATWGLFHTNNSNIRTLTLGASIITIYGVGNVWDITDSNNLTLNFNTSTIKISDTSSTAKLFIGGGNTYYNVFFLGDNITVVGNNTFSELRVQNAGLANGLLLTAGSTQTVNSFTTNASSGNLAIIKSTIAASAATITKASGVVSVDYMSIQDITVTTSGTATWFAGANSTNVSGNTGGLPWSFSRPPGRYWVGGGSTSEWNATGPTNWSASSGGANNASVPVSSDDVFFDSNSGVGNSLLSANITIRSLNTIGYTGTLTHNSSVTLSIGNNNAGAGNYALRFGNGMSYILGSNSTSAISFISTSSIVQSIDWGGKTTGNVTFNGAGGSWKYLSTHTFTSTALLTLDTGTLDTGNQTINGAQFDSSSGNSRTLILSRSIFNLTGNGNIFFVMSTANLTLPINSATININRPAYGASAPLVYLVPYNWWFSINFNGGGDATLTGGTGSVFGSISVNGAEFSNLNEDSFKITDPFTVLGNFTLNGYSQSRRLRVYTSGNTRVIKTASSTAVSGQYVDFSDIIFPITQDLSGIAGGAGDLGNNTGIIFSPSITCYWFTASSGTKQWNDASNWYLGSGGTGGQARIPIPGDDVIFDSNSIGASGTIINNNIEALRLGRNITWTGVTNNPIWNFEVNVTNYGSLTLDPNMTITSVANSWFTMAGSSSDQTFRLTTCGVILPHTNFRLKMNSLTNKVLFMDAFNGNSTNTTRLSNMSGVVDFNNQNITTGQLYLDSGNSILGNGLIKLTGTGQVFWYTAYGALSAESSNIELNNSTTEVKIFLGGNGIYNNLTISGDVVSSYIFSGSNTFNNFNDTKTVSHSLIFGSNTTTTFNGTISVSGSPGNLITLTGEVGLNFTWKKTSGTVSCDYIILSKSNANGGASFNAGNNSVNGGSNSGWNLPANHNFTWTGATNSNWSNTGNWVGGAVPGVSDVAYFTGVSVVNCTINSGCNVKGIYIGSSYTGVITLTTFATVGTNGFEINGGTFTCGAQNISCNGKFKQTSGTFSNTSGIFNIIAQGATIPTWSIEGGTHNRNTGTVRINGTSDAIVNNAFFRQFYHLDLNTSGVVSGTCFADGNLIRSQGSTLDANITVRLNYLGSGVGGSSAGAGSITFTGTASPQSFTYPYAPSVIINKSSGTVDIPADIQVGSNWNHKAGAISWNNRKVTFENTVSGNMTITNGSFYDVEIVKNNTEDVTVSGLCKIANQLTITSLGNLKSTVGSNTSFLEVSGNYVNNDNAWDGTSKIVMRGSGSNTYTGSGNQGVGMEVYKTGSGSVTLFSNLNIPNTGHDLVVRSGNLNLSTYNLSVNDQLTVYGTMTLSGLSSQVLTVSGTTAISSSGNFTLSATSSTIVYSDGTGTAVVTNLKKNFYNLTLGASKTHEFATGAPNATTINGRFASNGTSGTRSILRSLSDVATDWKLTLNGTSTLSNKVNVKRSDASGGLGVLAVGSINIGNNTNWVGLLIPPSISSITSSASNNTYGAGSNISVRIIFNEAVTLTGTIIINLDSGGSVAISSFAGTTATGTYTVLNGHTSSDLTATSVSVNGTIQNSALIDLETTLPAINIATGSNIVIDTTAPKITSISSSTANGTYGIGDNISIRINFSENITLTGTMSINLDSGGVCVISAFTGTTATGTYVVANGQSSSDLTASSVIINSTARDAALNSLSTTLPSTNIATGSNIVIDTTAPTIITKALGSSNAYLDVTFSEAVYTTNTTSGGLLIADFNLAFAANGGTATAVSITGVTKTTGAATSGGETTVRLTLSVTGSVSGTETITITPVAASIFDAAGNAASTSTTTGAVILQSNLAITVTKVTSSSTNGTYKTGDTITIQVVFDTVVTVIGTPQLTLETGSTDRIIDYVKGSGSTSLTFNYTVQSGDTSSDLDYTATTALSLNGGTIQSAAGINAILVLPTPGTSNSLGSNKALVIDTTAPTVTSVSSTTSDGSYGFASVITISVIFSEAVTVTGVPTLALETGFADQTASYSSGSGTTTLFFTYTVQSEDTNSDLDYSSTTALALSSETIKDAAGNSATLTLATPGDAGSLSSNADIEIDTTLPTVKKAEMSSNNDYVDITFSEPVFTQAGTGALIPSNFILVTQANAGTSISVTVTSILTTDETALVGGETKVRMHISITGTTKGNEKIVIQTLADTVFDKAGNAMLPLNETVNIKTQTVVGGGSSAGGCTYTPNATLNQNADWGLVLIFIFFTSLIGRGIRRKK